MGLKSARWSVVEVLVSRKEKQSNKDRDDGTEGHRDREEKKTELCTV